MDRKGRILVAALALLSIDLTATARADTPIGSMGTISSRTAPIRSLFVNGRVRVGTDCTTEFQNQDTRMEFYDRPSKICAVWDGMQPVEWAEWELWKDNLGETPQKLSQGPVPPAGLTGPKVLLEIPLEPKIPLHNKTDKKQRYRVKVVSKVKVADTRILASTAGLLIHLPKADEPKPQPMNPYACSPAPDKYLRYVRLGVAKTTVNQTTSTSGDGDRDELYVKVERLGPGSDQGHRRLPREDDYYEAKQGKEFTNNYTDQDEERVPAPTFWLGGLKHGEIVTLGVTAMEQDNSDLSNIKSQIIEAMLQVEKVALETKNEYGAIVAAVAAVVALHASLIPDTKGHDFIGLVVIRAENKCGHIRVVWTTFEEWKVDGIGTLSNKFVNWQDQLGFEARVIVLSTENLGFTPNGVDWGEYTFKGKADDFWWLTKGSSKSQYTFTVKSEIVPKDLAEAAIKAAAGVSPLPR